jgi:nucleoside-diphosphate-sugar epimerase
MLKCGITGFNGNLGKTFLKYNKKFQYIKFKGDISKKKEIEHWIKNNNFDVFIHFAALVPTLIVNRNYKKALNINYKGTKYLVDAIIKHKKKIDWLFFSSTSHVYSLQDRKIKENFKTNPSSKYGKTKLLAENYINKKFRNFQINYCIGRIFSIFDNKGDGFFTPSLIKKIKQKPKKIILDNLNHNRDFLSTKQIVEIIFYLYKIRFTGTINIASGKKTNLKTVAKIFARKLGKDVTFSSNNPTSLVANINKLKRLGFKQKVLNLRRYLN